MRLVWTAQARQELGEVVSYIWLEDPGAAKRMRQRIESTAIKLKSQPFMGRPGAIAGMRAAIPHPSYRMVYQVADEAVFILTIVHTARQWPPVDGEGGA